MFIFAPLNFGTSRIRFAWTSEDSTLLARMYIPRIGCNIVFIWIHLTPIVDWTRFPCEVTNDIARSFQEARCKHLCDLFVLTFLFFFEVFNHDSYCSY